MTLSLSLSIFFFVYTYFRETYRDMLYTFLDLFLPGIQKLICRITAREQIDIGRFGMNHDLQPVVSQSCTKKHGDWPRLRTTGGDCWFMDVHG